MKVSIIIPTYNVEQYIIECLQSVATQTFQDEVECLIVDDCGIDNSIPLAEKFIKEYVGSISFKIVHHKKNCGVSTARNSGMDVATGEYVYFLDPDDYIEPFTIEKLIEITLQHPKVEVIQAGVKTSKGNVPFDAVHFSQFNILEDKVSLQRMLVMPSNMPITCWNKLIKRNFLVVHGIRFYEGVIHEDVDFIYQMANYINCLAICHSNTYIYREQREGSILNTTNSERSLPSRLLIYNSILDNNNNIDKRILARSLFQRVQYVLLSPPSSKELSIELRALCNRIARSSTFADRIIMNIYFSLPNKLQRNRMVYSLFSSYH